MTNLEIDKALALAIGYLPEHVCVFLGDLCVYRPECTVDLVFDRIKHWHIFSHKDPAVILPIVIANNLTMHFDSAHRVWGAFGYDAMGSSITASEYDKDYYKCAALAVIELVKEGKI